MAKMILNKEQQNAVNSGFHTNDNKHHILVSAAAGSGKTTLLTERVMRLIKDGVDIDRLLIVTFTEDAAKHMHDKIEERLIEELKDDDGNEHLRDQLAKIDSADITTINAFTNKIVRDYYYCFDNVDPLFNIQPSDSLADDRMRNRVWKQTIQSWEADLDEYTPADNPKRILLESLTSNYKDDSLKEAIFDLYDFLSSLDAPEAWVKEKGQNAWAVLKPFAKKYLSDMEKVDSDAFLKKIDDINNYYDQNDIDDSKKGTDFETARSNEKYIGEYIKRQIKLAKLITEGKKDELSIAYNEYSDYVKDNNLSKSILSYGKVKADKAKFNGFPNTPNEDGSIPEKGEFDAEFKKFKTQYKEINGIATFSKPTSGKQLNFSEIINNINIGDSLLISQEFLGLYKAFKDNYEAEKAKYNVKGYSDLERDVQWLLANNDTVKKELQMKYQEVIIDEYQDTNSLQDSFLMTIAEKNWDSLNDEVGTEGYSFMVGDVKQSIYEFRHADPTVFMKKEREFKKDNDKAVITLPTNYRSREEIIDQVNNVFKQVMVGNDENQLRYGEDEKLQYGHEYDDYKEQSNILDPFKFKKVVDSEDKAVDEARLLAHDIKKLIDDHKLVYDRGQKEVRPIRYSDIAVLSRSMTHVDDYLKSLKDNDIPYVVKRDDGFFERHEIEVAMAWLRALNDSRDNVDMVAILRSLVYGVNEQELAFMKVLQDNQGGNSGKFSANWSINLILNAQSSDASDKSSVEIAKEFSSDEDFYGNLKAKLEKFRADLNYLSSLVSFKKPSELYTELLQRTRLIDYYLTTPHGEEKRLNLLGLGNYIKDLEESGIGNLNELINTIDTADAKVINKVTQIIPKNSRNNVTISTIHGAKGLEYPVVFLVNTDQEFNFSNSDSVRKNKDYGLAVSSYQLDSESQPDIPIYEKVDNATIILKSINDEETREEEKRMLYVAMTRAEQSLEIIAAEKPKKETANNKKKLPKTYLEWLKNVPEIEIEDVSAEELDKLAQSDETNVQKQLSQPDDITVVEEKQVEYDDTASEINATSRITDKGFKNMMIKQLDYHVESIEKLANAMPLSDSSQAEETAVDARDLGTDVHLIFERLNLAEPINKQTVQNEVQKLIDQGLITSELAKVINNEFIDGIVGLYKTKLGQEILKSGSVEREEPFTAMIQAKFLMDNDELADGDLVIVHGKIDGLFYDKQRDGWVIFDYKTDKDLDVDKVKKERYPAQLVLYKRAFEQATNKKVVGLYLYGIRNQQVFKISDGDESEEAESEFTENAARGNERYTAVSNNPKYKEILDEYKDYEEMLGLENSNTSYRNFMVKVVLIYEDYYHELPSDLLSLDFIEKIAALKKLPGFVKFNQDESRFYQVAINQFIIFVKNKYDDELSRLLE
ncbi:UvrD-helicase domain-containing protein [Limosilactobacillus mucosae]|uniref:UvrD-helicase domain-containing protein n=1 Tax=Limosilactobacillus mucosae TaxID=97478 RepID=UPI00233F421C|nr:UvrD-helicase domain-containing protein [Limosilactobacillus mucosae]MDC2838718.1 UvrD-helicase domain-containing protein [Limosilactobacillus mucosae]